MYLSFLTLEIDESLCFNKVFSLKNIMRIIKCAFSEVDIKSVVLTQCFYIVRHRKYSRGKSSMGVMEIGQGRLPRGSDVLVKC